mgnify:CR=1 FL=1
MFLRKIKNALSNIGGSGNSMEMLYYRLKYGLASFLGFIWSEERYAKWFYHLYTGKELDLENPKTFDQKLWWLKLNNRDPQLTRCCDKIAVREYVKECGYEDILIPQIDTFSSAKKLDFSKYDKEIVAKCTHNSGGHIFFDPKNPPSAKEINIAKKRLGFILKRNASVLSREWNYKNVPPRIAVEEVIRTKKGELPLDYKFMCFDGEPRMLFLDLGVINPDSSYNHDYPRNIYDTEFNLLPVFETRPNADYPVEKPENFERMVEIARTLSKPFPHCRVDLYNVDGKIYFGEITFYHGGGCNKIEPEEWDLKMGSWIDINSPKIVLKSK